MSYNKKRSDLDAAKEEKTRASVRVCKVVKVLAFYADTMTVDVQPLIKERIDGEYVSAAPVMGIRAACLCAGDYVIRPYYKRGDTGIVVVGDADADLVYSSGGEESESNTTRMHALEDAIFIGGVCPAGKAPSGLPDNALVLAAGSCYIAISSSGVSIAGNVTISGALTASGIEMTTHRHTDSVGGSTGTPT